MGYRTWSNEETEFLIKEYGRINIVKIARKLNRTVGSVRGKIANEGLGASYETQGTITASELARNLGRNKSTIQRWIHTNRLKCTKRKSKEKKKYLMIKIQDFWEFAKENPKYMRWELYERGSLPPEPKWLDSEIEIYNKNRVKKQKDKWSKEEDAHLTFYYKQGKNYKEIADMLGRTEDAIICRISKLNIASRMVCLPWKEEEIEVLINMREKGKSFEDIADELGRSECGVRSRWKRLKKMGALPICYAE